MLILMQVINHMIYLEYDRDEVARTLDHVANNDYTIHELFDSLNLELPEPSVINRFLSALPKRESAISIAYLRTEE